MGAQLAKPAAPDATQATQDVDMAVKGLHAMAENFMKDIRLGNASINGLGYQLAGGKLTDQEYKIVGIADYNFMPDDIKNAISAIFSQDWGKLAQCCANEVHTFLTGKSQDSSSISEWSKSYVVWENNSLLQYSAYVIKTSASSVGTLSQNAKETLLACVCCGVIAYETVDPQIIVYELRKSAPAQMSAADFKALIMDVATELSLASQLTLQMRKIMSSNVDDDDKPTPLDPSKPTPKPTEPVA